MVKEYCVSVKTIFSLDAMKFGYWYKTAIEIHIHQNDSLLAQICADGFIIRINHGANERCTFEEVNVTEWKYFLSVEFNVSARVKYCREFSVGRNLWC